MLFPVTFALALCVCNQTQGKSLPRGVVVEEFARWRIGLLSEFHVQYDVTRKIVRENGPYEYISLGNIRKEQPLLMHWGGEHAWRGDSSRDITVANPKPGDLESQSVHAKFSFRGRAIVANHQRSALVSAGDRNTVSGSYLPEEELFLEVIGFESRRQDVGVTLRGYKNTHKYDILKAITSSDYSMTASAIGANDGSKPQRLFRFELTGVDSFILSEAHGYAMIKRKWIWPDGSNGKGSFVEIENSNWKKVDDAIWIPFTSKLRYFAKPTSGSTPLLVLEETLAVTSASTRTSDKLFSPELKKGAAIATMPDGKAVTFLGKGHEDVQRYLSDLPGSEREDRAKSAERVSEGRRLLGRTRFRILIIVSVLLLVVLAALVVRILYYRKARRHERET